MLYKHGTLQLYQKLNSFIVKRRKIIGLFFVFCMLGKSTVIEYISFLIDYDHQTLLGNYHPSNYS